MTCITCLIVVLIVNLSAGNDNRQILSKASIVYWRRDVLVFLVQFNHCSDGKSRSCPWAAGSGRSRESHSSVVTQFLFCKRSVFGTHARGAPYVSVARNRRSLRTREWRSCLWRRLVLMNKEQVLCIGLRWAERGWRPGQRSPCRRRPSSRCASTCELSASTKSS